MTVQLVGADGKARDKSFILDTGCNLSLVTDTLAQDLGLKTQSASNENGNVIQFNGKPLQVVIVPQLRIGAILISNSPIVITDGKGLAGATGQATEGVIGQSADGVIGNNILFFFPALIDFQHNKVQFFRSSPVTPADLRSAGMDNAITVPLDTSDDSYIYKCQARLDAGGKSLTKDLQIDIGLGATTIDGQDAKTLGLPMKGATTPFTLVTGQTKMYVGKVTGVTLGNGTAASVAQIPDVTVAYPKGSLPDFSPSSLGRDVLSHYRVLLDFGAKKMYLAPLAPMPSIAPASVPVSPAPAAKP